MSTTVAPVSLPPGFRFHPTDEELIQHYLKNRASSLPCPVSVIADVNIYKFDPWDLPAMAAFGDREWYFFSPRDRKYPNGFRPNRSAASGYWKATGTDKPIFPGRDKLRGCIGGGGGGGGGGDGESESIGVKKALVFYRGRPPRGVKTEWIMHEYRLAEAEHNKSHDYKPKKLNRDASMRLDDWVLCRIYKKGSHHQSAMDADQEDSGAEEETALTLPKSYSFSELLDAADYSALSLLLDHPSSIPDQAFIHGHGSNNYLVQQQQQHLPRPVASPSFKTEHSLKRHDYLDFGHAEASPVKRPNFAIAPKNFTFVDQTFFNPQSLSNSHLMRYRHPT